MKEKIYCLIPAKSFSERLKNKNSKKLKGKSLFKIAIQEAKKIKRIDDLIFSSDSVSFNLDAKKLGCNVPFRRPKNYSTSEVSLAEVIFYTLKKMNIKVGTMILLQPTSPLRKAKHVNNALDFFLKNNLDSCFSAMKIQDIEKYYFEKDNCFHKISQNLIKVNGAIYIFKIDWFLKSKKLISPKSQPFFMKNEDSLDIDTNFDLKLAKFMIK